MKKYIGTKQVKAEPMTKGEAFNAKLLRAESILEDEIDEPGYKVVYPDGYESWSPAKVFEAAYVKAETALDRMAIEYTELSSKRDRLETVLNGEKYDGFDKPIKAMLHVQHRSMVEYLTVLAARSTRMQTGEGGLSDMSFSQVIPLLENGFAVRRSGWNGKDIVVFKQVPAEIGEETIPKMQSLPNEAKELIMSSSKHIDYTSQCLIFNSKTGRADSWVPSISDVFAKDWELV